MSQYTSSDLELWRKMATLLGSLSDRLEAGYDLKVLRTIQPIVDTRYVDCVARAFVVTYNLTAASETYVAGFTVPSDRMYVITNCVKATSWSAGGREFAIADPAGVFVAESDDVAAVNNLSGIWVPVPPGWSVGATATANAGDSARVVHYSLLDFPSAQGEVAVQTA